MFSEQYFSYIQDENELNKIEKREVLFQKDPSPIWQGENKNCLKNTKWTTVQK
jgi:hypothetical protein